MKDKWKQQKNRYSKIMVMRPIIDKTKQIMLPFRFSAVAMAQITGCPIVPIVILLLFFRPNPVIIGHNNKNWTKGKFDEGI